MPGRRDATTTRWLRPVLPFAAMAGAAYVVLLAIAVAWWLLTDETFAFVKEAAVGGAFLDFAVLLPGFLLLQALREIVARRRRSVRDQAPRAHEEVPPDPEPPSHEQPAPRTAPGGVPQQGPEADAVSPVSQHLPQGRGPEEHRPPDRSDHRKRPRWLAARGLIGWGVILVAGTVWELVALTDPHDDIPTVSAVLDVVGAFPVVAWALLALWVVLGFHLFRPD